ncbi:hypothetical protein KC19_2G089600 [Ceratodon purpureus]|uniref:Uncharacterized protein n=1 Tax=Ceratodon purpureus TaxID=3225 RepID=A0A8T0IUM5_CERPU|nr:hypothetical protein KC19_2G089600 [Ceratodon purpureus]
MERHNDLKKPLLGKEDNISGYETAGFWSRLSFSWLNCLLKEGASRTLDIDDIPTLSRHHKATRLYEQFVSNWPKEETPNSTRGTLLRTFWWPLLISGVLNLMKLSVVYVGPLLIQSFVDYTGGVSRFKNEGFVLVILLVSAKTVEVISTHMYQFTCNKLGMQVRSSLISMIYRKGLRLSSAARQSHGAGQIVNYMSVDVQNLSDVCLQIHNLWFIPAQLIIATMVLWSVVGVMTIAGVSAMASTAIINIFIARSQRAFQVGIMEGRDSRMKAFNEALNCMKVIKLQGWEGQFLKNVENARQQEFKWLWRYMYTTVVAIFVVWFTPLAATVAIFSSCTYFGYGLSPGLAFTIIATIRITQEPLRLFPNTLVAVSQAIVSLERLDKYLWSSELEKGAIVKLPFSATAPAVNVKQASFKWEPEAENMTLIDINLQIPRGALVTVVGKVGSGKSSLLASLLGEMPKLSGEVEVRGTTAYVAQSAWIQNGTIQDNILFGSPMNRTKYEDILHRCALEADLAQMEFGDQTEIGERGINMSGGQKQRIQLARAIYQDCDVYLFDDIFSAVDAHTGSHIFQKCIVEGLAGKTIILVTHQIEFLHAANTILVMREGRIVQSGQFQELLSAGLDFESLVEAHNKSLDMVTTNEGDFLPDEDHEPSLSTQRSKAFSRSTSGRTLSSGPDSPRTQTRRSLSSRPDWQEPMITEGSFSRSGSTNDGMNSRMNFDLDTSSKLIEEEERSSGRVGLGVYRLYLTTAYGGAITVVIMIIQCLWQALLLGGDYWTAYETGSTERFNPQRFISIYTILALACALCVMGRSFLNAFMSLITSQDFYLRMLRSVFRAPMAFFDTTPTGRILSRASTDQATMDVMLPLFFGAVLAVVFSAIGILVVVIQVTWQILILIVPLSFIYYSYQAYFIKSSRELTRLDAVTKAPVIHHFSETISGFVTIRCFRQEARFVETNVERVNSNLRMDFHNVGANEWIGFRLEMIGAVVLCASALLLVFLPPTLIKPELVGLSLSYSLQLNATLFIGVWLACILENKMVAVERISHYLSLPSEAPEIVENKRPAHDWPSNGTICLENLKLRYRPNTPLVLKGISLTIKGGNKVGVVGRTGSGKSTLVLALFRLVEASGGRILVDGVDLSEIGLSDLRTRLSIIPQDPTLFDGTIRSNLDPTGQYSDQELWEALRKCQLADIVQELDLRLESPVLENGENWSVGQRQLFCLGRALLKRSRVLVLDEATASVDTRTDALIQQTVREEFASCTVISIAHRIPSVMDCDKVIVLEKGLVKEYDSPSKLMVQRPESLFAALVHEYQARSTNTIDLRSLEV